MEDEVRRLPFRFAGGIINHFSSMMPDFRAWISNWITTNTLA